MDAQRRTTMKRAQAAAQGQPYAPSPNPSMYGPPQHAPSAPASLAPPRAGPDMKRFTLTDAPASVSSPGSMPERQSSVPPSSRPSTKPVQVKPQKPGPETFEAMGIQTTTMKKVGFVLDP